MSQAKTRETNSMTRTHILNATDFTLVDTGVPLTAAAHAMVDGEPITVVWSTLPIACTHWTDSQGPVHQPADRMPALYDSSSSTNHVWHAVTEEAQCRICGRVIAPWADVRHGHLTGTRLTEAAHIVVLLVNQDREAGRIRTVGYGA